MKIDSARALKAEIATRIVPGAIEAIRAQGGLSVTVLSLEKARTGVEPQLALGLAAGRGAGDVTLAVRL
ncbi:hypothetical protein PQJ75_21060 [Rhodoplanes sp. TEM]|uniref:Uncharacterized protein n=1 Tax=Rhodoplanes tepidamans TaxID=200616 RepID=A0ABT5JF97_RHOTP|nr:MULTISPECIES: hypothetical protein [Rhodoplanes]MDC7788292.1 hypothetical protein [Rhodoplanes tepidamans]MDC7986228.1 hypothetical protein [Rhodoplanes sp. TEM]MDQ0355655.1 hypothetical protein [Rhodoplanes tepidamans]